MEVVHIPFRSWDLIAWVNEQSGIVEPIKIILGRVETTIVPMDVTKWE